VLTHQGGFPVFPHEFDWSRSGDWQAVTEATARLQAVWAPGTAVGYHPVTYGFVLGELVRRVDGRMPRAFLRDEVFAPLGAALTLGVEPDEIASVVPIEAISEVTWDDPEGSERRTSEIVARFNAPATLTAQIPAANIIGTAEGMARCYAMLQQGGVLGGVRVLRAETVAEATRVQVATEADRTSGFPAAYGLGFLVGGFPPLDQPGAYGHFGQQSSVGYVDPVRGLAVGFVTNGLHDPATVALRHAEVAAAVIAACE
jgi:CubicO group peptidase (beta-lactamase class C family)